MTGTDWLDQLEQKAAAATPGPWHVHEMSRVYVGNGAPGALWQIVHASGDNLADLTADAASRERTNAEFIAAANPHTVQRLIDEVRKANQRPTIPPKLLMDYRVAKDQADRQRARADALAAKVARVEALVAEHTESDGAGREWGDIPYGALRAALNDGSDQ